MYSIETLQWEGGVRKIAVVLVKYVCFMYLFKSSPVLFGAFHSLIGDLKHKFKLTPRVPMITGFSFPGGSNIFEDQALGYSFQEVSRFIE